MLLCTILRHNDTPEDTKLKNGYEDDPELTAQLHQTLADFEANLAGEDTVLLNQIHIHIQTTVLYYTPLFQAT